MKVLLPTFGLILAAAPLYAQSEDDLRQYFEGRSVVVKMEMPGTDEGVDVYPNYNQPIDYPNHAKRLKRFGTAIHRGDEVMITKVKVKKDLIEFQLGGGGYGTFGDDDSPNVSWTAAPKSEREKNLDKDIDREKDPEKLRKLKEERDRLRSARAREDARNKARAEEAKQIKEANIRQRRIEGGSRFNIRYKPGVPVSALTPEAVMAALDEFVDFSPTRTISSVHVPPVQSNELRRGMLVEDVDALLGRPERIDQRQEGSLTVSTSVYRRRVGVIIAEFVEGVLIRYRVQ